MYGDDFWVEKLLFRDYLQSHPKVAESYEKLKRNLIDKLGPDPNRNAYNSGKADFIKNILTKAYQAEKMDRLKID